MICRTLCQWCFKRQSLSFEDHAQKAESFINLNESKPHSDIRSDSERTERRREPRTNKGHQTRDQQVMNIDQPSPPRSIRPHSNHSTASNECDTLSAMSTSDDISAVESGEFHLDDITQWSPCHFAGSASTTTTKLRGLSKPKTFYQSSGPVIATTLSRRADKPRQAAQRLNDSHCIKKVKVAREDEATMIEVCRSTKTPHLRPARASPPACVAPIMWDIRDHR